MIKYQLQNYRLNLLILLIIWFQLFLFQLVKFRITFKLYLYFLLLFLIIHNLVYL